ncbi:CCA tRNA nucleotidyltransferase [Odoribacter lunatus]|uniref:CCA tRNA nucleotidyltransferase n=1 Tax=Odoribacter lunatus TaxID=2941335 RepID=UPI00203FB913|nr:HD domain-containing protein [Odoribacter lunatus]
MKKYLQHPIFNVLSDIAEEKNAEIYVIGGYVRDLLLDRPSKDIDIVVRGNGIELAQTAAQKLGKQTVSVFKNFGTAMFQYKGIEIEFVGARKESYRADSRKPIVEEGTIEDDQKRRDFTINALAISLNKATYGQLIDPFGGLQHLEERLIKTPLEPGITFSDDPLRMMRAIRFASQLNFKIEAETFKAIQTHNQRLSIISMERIMDEFNKIMLSPEPSKGIGLLDEAGLLEQFFPELTALKGVEVVNGVGHKDNFCHTLTVLDTLSLYSNDLWLRWAALLHDIAKPVTKKFIQGQGWTFYGHNHVGERMVAKIFNRLKLPQNEKMKYVQKLVKLHMRPIVLSEEIVTDSAVRRLLFDAGNDIDDLMTLAEADITSKNEERVKRFLNNFKIVRQKLKEVEEKDSIRNFQPPINGEEIIATFNLPPCRLIGDIKNAIKEAILDGIIGNNPEEARRYMFKIAAELGVFPQQS